MKVLDLFSGIGGFSLGLERAGFETVAFCECEPFCQEVLKKHWPNVPIFDDVNNLRGNDVGPVDVICGGYPCQPFSTCGKREGKDDDRHLWPEYLRLIREIRPAWVIAENVAGHISMGLDDVLFDLAKEGYSAWTFIIPACAVDAKHRRDRVWIVANNNSGGLRDKQKPDFGGQNKTKSANDGQTESLAHTGRSLLQERHEGKRNRRGRAVEQCASSENESTRNAADSDSIREQVQTKRRQPAKQVPGSESQAGGVWREWPTEPAVGRVANGVPNRVDRLRALGNAVVPQIPEIIGRAILEVEAVGSRTNP